MLWLKLKTTPFIMHLSPRKRRDQKSNGMSEKSGSMVFYCFPGKKSTKLTIFTEQAKELIVYRIKPIRLSYFYITLLLIVSLPPQLFQMPLLPTGLTCCVCSGHFLL